MKKMYLFAAFAAAFAFLACTKEMAAPEQNEGVDEGLVPFSFYATVDNSEGEDSKVFINTETGKVNWKSGDKLSVFDNADNYATNHVFTANTDGVAVSFDGSLNAGFANFTAIYPYSEEIVYTSGASNPIAYDIPVIQEAVKGSFDPKAARYVATGTNLSDKLSFKAAFALLKVNVDVADVVALYVENTSRDMSGSVFISTGAGVGNGTGTRYRRITLKKSDDSVLEQGDYYIVVRFLNPDSPDQKYSNFKLTYIKEDASCLTRAASSDVLGTHVARGTVADLGSLSSFNGDPAVSWFTYYQAGLDVKIGSKTINWKINGDAELLTADNTVTEIAKAKFEGGGVKFLKAVGTGTFSQVNNPTIAYSSYFLADGASPVQVAMTNVLNLADGALYIKGLQLSISGKSAFFTVNKNTDSSMTEFIADGCHVVQNVGNFISTNSSFPTYGIRRTEFVNNRFFVSAAANIVNVTSTYAGANQYKEFVFKNNYVFGTTDANTVTSIFAYTGTATDAEMDEIVVNNNIFYNATNAGIMKFNKSVNVEAKYNIIWAKDGTTYSNNSNGKLFGLKTAPTGTVAVTDNAAFGTLGAGSWVIADSTPRENMEALEVATSDPIASANVATGVFTMASGYVEYGPQGI